MSDWTQEQCNELCRSSGLEATDRIGMEPDFESIKVYMRKVNTREDIINHMEFLNSIYSTTKEVNDG